MLGLFTLNWMLNNFLGSLIVILVVMFQADIRRALTGVGARSFFATRVSLARAAEELTDRGDLAGGAPDRRPDRYRAGDGPQDYVATGRANRCAPCPAN